MKKVINISTCVFTITMILSLFQPVYAQLTNISAFKDSLLFDNSSARSTALADANIAEAGHLISYSVNPALLSFINKPQSIYVGAFQDWRNNFSHFDLVTPSLTVRNKVSGIFRFSYSGTHLSPLNPLGKAGEPEPNLNQYQLENAVSFKFSRVFSTGILQTLAYTDTKTGQYWTYSAKSGLFYNPVGSLSYAAVISGIGRGAQYGFTEDSTAVLGSYNIPVKFEIGASFSFPEDTDDPDFILSLSNEKRFGEEGVWYKGGMEIKFLKHLFVRSGIQFQPELDYYMPRFGIGFKSNLISFDYGLAPGTQSKIDGRYHQLGLTIHL